MIPRFLIILAIFPVYLYACLFLTLLINKYLLKKKESFIYKLGCLFHGLQYHNLLILFCIYISKSNLCAKILQILYFANGFEDFFLIRFEKNKQKLF